MKKKLTKSRDKIIAGVFGGIADYFGLDHTVVRLIGAAIIIFTCFFPGILFYIAAALIMPEPDSKSDVMNGNFKKKE